MIGASIREPKAVSTRNYRSGGIWDYVSPSRLNCWLTCLLKFKIRYIDRIRTPTTPALFLGKQVHAGLEVFYRHRQLGITLEPSDVAARMAAGWDAAVAEEGMTFTSTAARFASSCLGPTLAVSCNLATAQRQCRVKRLGSG